MEVDGLNTNHKKRRIVKNKEIKDNFAATHFLSGEVLPVTVDNLVTDQHQSKRNCAKRPDREGGIIL